MIGLLCFVVAVLASALAQTPGAIRPYYRRMIKALVAQALDN